jgi:hypothetical protein
MLGNQLTFSAKADRQEATVFSCVVTAATMRKRSEAHIWRAC